MPLKNRRGEYSWTGTRIDRVEVTSDKRSYSLSDVVGVVVSFRLVGGLREAFHPDVWTVSWEDFDKILRVVFRVVVSAKRGLGSKKLAEAKKEVRKASFYWSRDPDLPYRIWAMVIPEDGGPPKIPLNVEDAKSKMLDFEKKFEIPASTLGPGKHQLVSEASAKWARRSFIEKGSARMKSKAMVIEVEE